eukprot:3855522-Rhodomonas_salina.1
MFCGCVGCTPPPMSVHASSIPYVSTAHRASSIRYVSTPDPSKPLDAGASSIGDVSAACRTVQVRGRGRQR